MRSKQQNKLRCRVSKRHKDGKPLEQLQPQIENALQKIKDVELVLRGVLDELTNGKEERKREEKRIRREEKKKMEGLTRP
jgi:predicted  nucleic acid-binding Zn-ribbon protein